MDLPSSLVAWFGSLAPVLICIFPPYFLLEWQLQIGFLNSKDNPHFCFYNWLQRCFRFDYCHYRILLWETETVPKGRPYFLGHQWMGAGVSLILAGYLVLAEH